MPKRDNYISWDEYFMGISLLSSMRSKDPNTQVGACIVGDDNKIVSVGYNGFPRGCNDDDFPWERSGEKANDTKYPFVCHAELNAILEVIISAVVAFLLRCFRVTNVRRLLFKAELKRLFIFPTNMPNPRELRQARECSPRQA